MPAPTPLPLPLPWPIIVTSLLALLYAGWVWSQPWRLERRRDRLRAQPFPVAWRRILRRRVPLYRRLPVDLQLQLKRQIQVFIAEKPFIGCAGQAITDDVRVTIAAQACLLRLNRPPDETQFEALRQVLVYPGAFVVDRIVSDGAGVRQDQRRALAGESWQAGQVILSWADALDGAAVPDDGRNIVIHEFAHQLCQESGAANGAPRLGGARLDAAWLQALQQGFERLRAELRHAAPSGYAVMLGTYAATEPAEFLAVASEGFFERPAALAGEAPVLYAQLRRLYHVDPANWYGKNRAPKDARWQRARRRRGAHGHDGRCGVARRWRRGRWQAGVRAVASCHQVGPGARGAFGPPLNGVLSYGRTDLSLRSSGTPGHRARNEDSLFQHGIRRSQGRRPAGLCAQIPARPLKQPAGVALLSNADPQTPRLTRARCRGRPGISSRGSLRWP